MRVLGFLLLLTTAQIAQAAAEAPYYGPMKAWHGIGYKFGYKHEVEPDGSWRVVATTRRDAAIDMAMYRAAELAREQGFAYVELLGGSVSGSPGVYSAILYARPSNSSAAPAICRSKKRDGCYTAEVAKLLRALSGDGGTQPGVAATDHYDRYGRAVSYSGFGVGAASPMSLRSTPPVAATVPTADNPVPIHSASPAAAAAIAAAAAAAAKDR